MNWEWIQETFTDQTIDSIIICTLEFSEGLTQGQIICQISHAERVNNLKKVIHRCQFIKTFYVVNPDTSDQDYDSGPSVTTRDSNHYKLYLNFLSNIHDLGILEAIKIDLMLCLSMLNAQKTLVMRLQRVL